MKRFDIITIFPAVFDDYLNASILARAQKKKLVKFTVHDLRKWAKDKHKTVDDKPYGGGPGMIIKVEPIYRAVSALTARRSTFNVQRSTRIVLFSASGRQFTQRVAEQYAKKYDRIIFICGRYEGVDARVGKYIADEELSIGPYVLTGGELPAMVVADAITRLLPGVLGNKGSLLEETFNLSLVTRNNDETRKGYQFAVGEYPQYTRPEVFYSDPGKKKSGWRVPKVLLSGNPKKIGEWKRVHMK